MNFLRSRPGRLVGGAALAVATLVPAVLQSGLRPADASETRSCAWVAKVDPTGVNALFPDEAAHYWVLALAVAPGDSVVLRGRYPHSRYFSFTTYDPALRSADGLNDARITPDAGSTNPFAAGADRRVAKRDYTVTVKVGNRPAVAPANTLFTGSADGTRTNQVVSLVYRNYRQDKGLGDDGGVGLPSVAVSTAAGLITVPQCDQATIPPNDLNTTVATAPSPPYPALVGTANPEWRKFYNLPTSAAYFLTTMATGTTIGDLASPLTTATPSGGFADNPDNKYVATVVSSGVGSVAIIESVLPTFPATYRGQRRMGSGQLRYWSMCSEEFATGRYYSCLVDDQLPLGPGRTFTIMVSTAADRPANAVPSCGIAWLPMGPAADTVLLERNMLADPGFHQSIQAARQGHEREDLGRYYPSTRYATVAQAEALGCKR